ncbi:hypothetical protein KCU93_g319, partial [Aureobasidium melanogenum]
MSHPISDMDPLIPFDAMAEPRAAATSPARPKPSWPRMLPPKVAILIATAYSLGTTPRTGMTRLMAKICKTHLSRSQLQRQRQPTTIPFVLNVQENRGHIGVCPRASSLSMPEKSHCEDRLYYRDIFEFRYIGPRIEMQSDPKGRWVREMVLITGEEIEVTACTADPGIYFLSARRKNVSWKPRRAAVHVSVCLGACCAHWASASAPITRIA